MVDEAGADRRRGDRGRRHGRRCGSPPNGAGVPRRRPGTDRRRGRGDPRRGGGRLAYLAVTSLAGAGSDALVVFDTGRRQLAVHLRARGSGSTSSSASTSAPRGSPSASASTGRRRRAGRRRGAGRDRRRPLARLDGRPRPTSSSGWAARSRTSPPSSTGSSATTPTSVQGTVLDRDEIDRQIELYRTRTADERRTIAGLQPKRAEVILAGALHRAHGARQARPGPAHRERPRPPPRSDRRAIRPVATLSRNPPSAGSGQGARMIRALSSFGFAKEVDALSRC